MDQEPLITENPLWWRLYLSSFVPLFTGMLIASVAIKGVSLNLVLSLLLGAAIASLLGVAFRREGITVTDTYIEGHSGLRGRVRIPLTDLNAARSGQTALGDLRFTSNRGVKITLGYLTYTKTQRQRIKSLIGKEVP